MNAVPQREGVWRDPDSRREFFYRMWVPADATTLLIILHGFGDHGGRFLHVAEALAGQGMAVALPDLWGHGQSGGARGDAEAFRNYIEDVQILAERVLVPESRCSRLVVYGHSFGGLLAIHWALRRPPGLARLVIQSPLLAVGFRVPLWKQLAARWVGHLWPSASLPMDLDVSALSHDPAVQRGYREDPLVHRQMSARIYRDMLRAGTGAVAKAQDIEVPTLLLYGEADRIVSIETARRWFDGLVCQKRSVSFPGAYHELHLESVREEIVRLVSEWTLAS